MEYPEAISYIVGCSNYNGGFLSNPQDVITFGLRRTEWLLRALNNPERRYLAVHVAGTKGKGSTAACLAAILRASGQRVGLFTSPHLHTFRERIQIDGQPISEREFADGVAELAQVNERLMEHHPDWGGATAFEVSTALAFLAFAHAGVDSAVIEVGLGGRYDSTNVLLPEVAVITSISLDHTQILGKTLREIATDKGGIIKPGRPVVSAPQRDEVRAVLEQIAAEQRSPISFGGRDWQAEGTPASFDLHGPWGTYAGLRVALRGGHQVENVGLAVAACQALSECGVGITEAAVRDGLANVVWPGRMETIHERPLVLVDGAHNVDSAERLAVAIRDEFPGRKLTVILGIADDKDVEGFVRALVPSARRVIVTASGHPRAAAPERILAAVRDMNLLDIMMGEAASVEAGLRQAMAAADLDADDEIICATGSLYVVAEAREALGLASPSEIEGDLLYR